MEWTRPPARPGRKLPSGRSVDGLKQWLPFNYLSSGSLCTHSLWDPKSGTVLQIRQEPPRRSSPANFPRCLYNGRSATDTRQPHPRIPGRTSPPARTPRRRRRGRLTSGAPLPSRPRLPERPHVHRLLQRDGGRPAPAGIVRARVLLGGDTARGSGGRAPRSEARAAVTGRRSRLRAPESPAVRAGAQVRPHEATPRPRPLQAGAASLPSRPRPRPLGKQHPGARPEPTQVERSVLTVHRARRIRGAPFSAAFGATENWGGRGEATRTRRASPSRCLSAPSC